MNRQSDNLAPRNGASASISEDHSTPFFISYGWVIIVVAALAMVATIPGRTHGLGIITERVLVDPRLELSRTSYADMNLWATLLGGLFCLPCGYLIDRFGLRLNLTVTLAALGAVVLWMTQLSGWWNLFFALMLTRGFGQSALSIISITMVAKWYKGQNTLPMAIYTFILSGGFAAAFQQAKPYDSADWRVVWGAIGWGLLAFTPLALILTKDPPSVDPANDSKNGDRTSNADVGFTLTQAMMTPAFWLFGLAISAIALNGAGHSLFSQSVLTKQGFSKEVFYNLTSYVFMIGMIVKLPIGWLGQHCKLNHLHAAGLFLLSVSLWGLPYVHTDLALGLYVVGTAVSGTITTILFFSVWGQMYGRTHLGRIQGVAQMMTVIASSLGPKLFAECLKRFDSYAPAFQALAGVVFLLAMWSLVVHMPTPSEASQPADKELTPHLAVQESPA